MRNEFVRLLKVLFTIPDRNAGQWPTHEEVDRRSREAAASLKRANRPVRPGRHGMYVPIDTK